MIGIVVVSHSRTLAEAARELATQMVPDAGPTVVLAAGLDDGSLGTDAAAVARAIEEADSPAGVLVIMDLGSAVLSAETALDFLDDDLRERVHLTPAPLVEGLVAALVTAAGDGDLITVAGEAERALSGKLSHLSPVTPASQTANSMSGEFKEDADWSTMTVEVVALHGLHARPAAVLVGAARRGEADVQVRNLTTESEWVDATSLAMVTTLGAVHGHELQFRASGPNAAKVLGELRGLAATGFGDLEAPADTVLPEPIPGVGLRAASPGYGIGPVIHVSGGPLVVPDHEPGNLEQRHDALDAAIETVHSELEENRSQAMRTAGPAEAAIFDAHALMLEDPAILGEARQRIEDGEGPASAWSHAMESFEKQLSGLGDAYLRARAADVRGVSNQVLRLLVDAGEVEFTGSGILVAEDLDPVLVNGLDPKEILGIVLAEGSPTAHSAILARAKGIPMVTGAGWRALAVPEGVTVVVDGVDGAFIVNPDEAAMEDFRGLVEHRDLSLREARKAAHGPAFLTGKETGRLIPVYGNVGSVDDAIQVAKAGADGSGLVRTEFVFAEKSEPPTREEQEEIYRGIAEAFDGRRVVIRTLDAGGDKPLAFMSVGYEDNPFLGVRGLRLSLRHPEILMTQLAAICSVARDYPLGIMFPMVSRPKEMQDARALLLRAAGPGGIPDQLQVGMMVEVPSAAMHAASFIPYVDFFSVGTNDLTQYGLAADRGNPALADLADGMDPGVLGLIKTLCRSAGEVPVSVCGELAADVEAVPVLLGLGVSALSVTALTVAPVKERIRQLSEPMITRAAKRALSASDSVQSRRRIRGMRR